MIDELKWVESVGVEVVEGVGAGLDSAEEPDTVAVGATS